VENADAVFTLIQMDNSVLLVARSSVEAVNAGAITRHFGGGGHDRAASATLHHADIPNFYFSTYESPYGQFDEHYKEWQESYVHTYPDNASDEEKLTPKKTGISSFKIDADNAEKFNNIRKIGLFIPIKNNASDTFNFKITEACVIFSHETDISEVYV
jgi:hypothetical protein